MASLWSEAWPPPAASLAGTQTDQTGANSHTTSSGEGSVIITLPVNVISSAGMVMIVPGTGSVSALQAIPPTGTEMLEEEPLDANAKQYQCLCESSKPGTNYRQKGNQRKEETPARAVPQCGESGHFPLQRNSSQTQEPHQIKKTTMAWIFRVLMLDYVVKMI